LKVLCIKIKDPKQKTKVLLETNVQKANLKSNNHLQRLQVLLIGFHQKNALPTLSHGEGRWGKGGFKE
jgi:hypothetical protein